MRLYESKPLANGARAARAVEVVRICERALRDGPKARAALLREIAFARYADAFKNAVLDAV